MSQFTEDFGPILGTLKLKKLELEWNRIKSVEPFVDLSNVEEIVLSFNGIEQLPANSFSGCPKLTYLSLLVNPISSLGV